MSAHAFWAMLGAMFRMLSLAALLLALVATSAQAQAPSTSSRDQEARDLFAAGSTAFEDARYEDALAHFQRAYQLSGRAVLLYNVGLAADRLRRDRVALEAFDRFLAEVPTHPRRRDVEARVVVLRQIVTEADAAAAATAAATPTPATTPPPAAVAPTPPVEGTTPAQTAPMRDEGPGALSIVGPVTLGALGLAGVLAALVGLTGGGNCVTLDGSVCVEERQTNWVGVGVYGGLGLASLAGGLIWLIVAMSGGSTDDSAPVALTPRGIALHWSL